MWDLLIPSGDTSPLVVRGAWVRGEESGPGGAMGTAGVRGAWRQGFEGVSRGSGLVSPSGFGFAARPNSSPLAWLL